MLFHDNENRGNNAVRCRLCGHDKLVLVHNEKAVSYHSGKELLDEELIEFFGCDRCGLIQIHPLPPDDFFENYYATVSPASLSHDILNTVKKEYYDTTVKFLKGFPMSAPKRVFEAGAASGKLLHMLADTFGADVAAIEPSDEARAFAQKEFNISILPGSIESLDIDAAGFRNAFDLNVCCAVLEHVPWPVPFIAKLAGMLKPDGLLYVEVPSLGFAKGESPVEKVIQRLHLCYYTPHALSILAAEAGLTLLHIEEDSSLYVPIYRVMYRNSKPLVYSSGLFERHEGVFRSRLESALNKCKKYIAAYDVVWIWGIGDDFSDLLSMAENVFDTGRCRLVDNNPAKTGKSIGKFTISRPDPLVCGKPGVILIAPNSRLIQQSILSEAKRLFPDTEIIPLF